MGFSNSSTYNTKSIPLFLKFSSFIHIMKSLALLYTAKVSKSDNELGTTSTSLKVLINNYPEVRTLELTFNCSPLLRICQRPRV